MVAWREGVKIFIHIGNSISVMEDDIILILDKNSVSLSKDNIDLINRLMENGINEIEDEIKSYILVRDLENDIGIKLYVSNISSISLMKRKGYR